jgi:hypothetical protein
MLNSLSILHRTDVSALDTPAPDTSALGRFGARAELNILEFYSLLIDDECYVKEILFQKYSHLICLNRRFHTNGVKKFLCIYDFSKRFDELHLVAAVPREVFEDKSTRDDF